MPVTKARTNGDVSGDMPMHHGYGHHMGSHSFGRKLIWTLVGILLVYGIIFVGTLIRNNLQKYYFIGRADRAERTIRVEADGKVTVKPDIAMTTMGMIAEAKTVAEAQAKNTEVMNRLVAKLKELGVEEKDIQTTNYNIYPQYNYTESDGRELLGYEVNQSVTIKIRDLGKASQIIALAGEVGANSVSGLSFVIDDPEVYKAEAREIALGKIRERANALSQALGVKLVSVYSYDEREGGADDKEIFTNRLYAEGLGGGGAPDIQSGSSDVVLTVGVTFEIR